MNPKQVLVWNNALKVRKGKFGAQIAHASTMSLLSAFQIYPNDLSEIEITLFTQDKDTVEWLSNKVFKKIVAKVNSEEELLELYKKVSEAKLPHCLIKDAGLTEFKGIPTITCLGIGPTDNDLIDTFTGHLQLM